MTQACDRCKRVIPNYEPTCRLDWRLQGTANSDHTLRLDLCLDCMEHLDHYVRGELPS